MRHTSRLRSFAWYGTVILLVLLAVTVSVARLVIGSASEYRERVEEMAGQFLGQPVTISNMDARLLGIQPTLLFKDVSLREPTSHERLAHFDQIGIALNPLSSLRHLQPILDLTIHGANIVIIQQENGGFSLQGVTLSEKAKSGQGGGDLGAWFLSQSRLALENSRIIWRNDKTGRDIVFEGVSVELQNVIERHRLNASVQLPEEIGKTLRLALDIRGNLLNQNDWVGDLYIKAAQVKPSQWVKGVEYQGLSFDRGDVNLEIWSTWRNGLLETIEGEFDLADLKIKRNAKALPVNRLSGQWRYRTGDEGWQLLMQNAVIRNGDEQTTPFSLQIEQLNGLASVRAENLDIDRLMNFSPYLPGLNRARHKQLERMMPGGWVDTLRVDLRDGELIGAVAAVKDFHCAPWQQMPGVSGLTARLGFDGNNGSIELDSRDLVLTLPELFENTLPLQRTRGAVRVGRLGKGWRVVSDDLDIDNEDLHMMIGMSLQLQPGESPLLALIGSFKDGRAHAVPTYLPVKIMPAGSVQWLKRAFLGGLVTSGSVMLHGRMEHSLLQEKQGRFEVRFDANDVTLSFMEDWPLLKAARGEALFTGRGMQVNLDEGRIYGSRIGKTVIGIDDFQHALLLIEGSVQASAQDALRFLREAPFSRDMGLQSFTGQGNTPIQLKLSIPLADAVVKKMPLSVKGSVALQGNHFQFARGVELSNARGELNFTEKSFSAEEITAKMYGFPATLTVFTERGKPDQRGTTTVAVRGHATVAAVRKELDLQLLEMASGESDWQARMTLTPGEEGGVSLDIFSDLNGVALNLPKPMGKAAEIERSLSLSLGLGGQQRGIHSLQYAGLFNATWQLQPNSGKMQRLGVLLGQKGAAKLPKNEVLQLGGTMDNLHWLEWRKVINHYFPEQQGEEKMPLVIAMQRLHLAKMEGEPEKSDALTRMPKIDLNIRDFAYDDIQLGGIAGRVEPSPTRVSFRAIRIDAPNFKLEGSGRWRPGGKTRLQLALNSGNLGKMFRDLGFASVIDGGKTKAHGDVEWPGSPLEFSLKTMAAKGRVNIEDGVIDQIDPGAGKLLGLLSLEALPRRLFLDFSDLSGKGLKFSSIKGDLRIRDGNARTDNLVVKSSPADILVTGRTGLVARDFDQLVSVVPNVAGTVSVAGALAWGPQVAAVLAIIQGLFKSGIDEATMTQYEIHGTWEKPEIIRLEPEPVAETENKIPGID
jgi:uncharacterized protein (TIGR02099 family)